jgi:hypothetical protein
LLLGFPDLANILAVFPLPPVLWQKLSMLDNVWHDLPATVRQSWWSQWGCYGSQSLPYMLLKVSEHASIVHCCSISSSALFLFSLCLRVGFLLVPVCRHVVRSDLAFLFSGHLSILFRLM